MPFMTIKNDAFPFLMFGEATKPMPWDHGSIYSLRLKSTFLRFTQRGMQYSNSPSVPLIHDGKWKTAHCAPTSEGLCAFNQSQGNMLWFPNTKVDIPDDFSRIKHNNYLTGFLNGSSCSSPNTGRAVKMFDERYEVSLCDLLDSNLDIVFHNANIYWRQDTTSVWIYITISVLCVYLTSCVSDNIVSMMTHNIHDHREQIFVLYGIVVLICYLFIGQDTYNLLLTKADRDLLHHLFAFVVIQAIAQNTYVHKDIHGARISMFTACIALLTLRVHYSFDNPYMLVLCILFGVRSFFKFMAVLLTPSSIGGHWLMLCDFFVFCSMLDNGLMANSSDKFTGMATQVVLMLVCLLVSVLIFTYQAFTPPAVEKTDVASS